VRRIDAAVSRNDYGMAATTTAITLEHKWIDTSTDPLPTDFEMIRGSVVYTGSEPMTLSDMPVETLIRGDVIELDRLYDGIEPGRTIVVTGERRDVAGTSGLRGAEVAEVAAVAHATAGDPALAAPGDRVHTFLQLATPLRHRYVRATAVIWGNVAHATNGETRTEVLGSGDASTGLQRFGLRQPPLTYVAAATTSGIASTLEARVNDVRWPEVGSLAEVGPADRGFVTVTDDSGARSLVFGDGEHGARLPTGIENLRARYRTGIGPAANVAAGRISLLATKPLGVRDVINPVGATGGAGPDDRDQLRVNAPLPLKALDRLVSVADYADFSRTFAGIGKADASRLVVRGRRGIFVTVAGIDDIPIDPDSELLVELRAALRRFGDPDVGITVAARELLLADLELAVTIDPDREWSVVEAALRTALLAALGFRTRELGRDLAESEVLAAAHRVAGVVRCRLTAMGALLYNDGEITPVAPITSPAGPGQPPAAYHPGRRLVAAEAGVRPGPGGSAVGVRPAQLLVLGPTVNDTLRLRQDTP
jgi:predicted phage baseplate assembly protein